MGSAEPRVLPRSPCLTCGHCWARTKVLTPRFDTLSATDSVGHRCPAKCLWHWKLSKSASEQTRLQTTRILYEQKWPSIHDFITFALTWCASGHQKSWSGVPLPLTARGKVVAGASFPSRFAGLRGPSALETANNWSSSRVRKVSSLGD